MSAPDALLHDERLWPSPAAWLVAVIAAAFVGVALLPLDPRLAAVAAVAAAAAVAVLLVRASTVVRVSREGGLQVGRATLPARFVAAVEPARGERARALRGVELDARTYRALRSWVGPVVLVTLDDPDDPTPAWLVSSRSPEHLARALRDAAGMRA